MEAPQSCSVDTRNFVSKKRTINPPTTACLSWCIQVRMFKAELLGVMTIWALLPSFSVVLSCSHDARSISLWTWCTYHYHVHHDYRKHAVQIDWLFSWFRVHLYKSRYHHCGCVLVSLVRHQNNLWIFNFMWVSCCSADRLHVITIIRSISLYIPCTIITILTLLPPPFLNPRKFRVVLFSSL